MSNPLNPYTMPQDAHAEYDKWVAEYQSVMKQRAATAPGEKHNELTRQKNALRAKIQEARAKLPQQLTFNSPEEIEAHAKALGVGVNILPDKAE